MESERKFILTTLTVMAGVCMGYSIYIDWKGRSEPEDKKKLQVERRIRRAPGAGVTLPNLQNREAVEQFFNREFKRGEELLSKGKIEDAIEHLCNAVAVATEPQKMLQVLQQILPHEVFGSILEHLPEISQRLLASLNGSG